MMQSIRRRLMALAHYRGFVKTSIINDVRMRFSRSSIGGLWVLLQPLAQSAIFAFVLAIVLKAKLPGIDDTHAYAAYLLSGMLCWSLFMESTSRGLGLFTDNAGLIKKMNFPLLTLPVIGAGISLVNNIFLFLATMVILALLGFFPSVHLVLLPLMMLLTLVFGLSLGLVLGIVNVFVRDIGVVVPIVLQFLFWLCPIVYSPASLPAGFRELVLLNPVSGLVQAYQAVLVFQRMPEWHWLLPPLILALISLVLARFLLRRTFAQMVDIL